MKKWNIAAVGVLLVLFALLIRSQSGDHHSTSSFPSTDQLVGMSYSDLIDNLGEPTKIDNQMSMTMPDDGSNFSSKTLTYEKGSEVLMVGVVNGKVASAAIVPKS